MKLDKEGGLQPEIAAFGGGRLPPRAAQKHARTCKKLPVASFCASETAETGRIANGREQGDHVSRRQESFKVFCPTFCTLQKVGVAAERQKNLILFVRICCFGCADSRFGKTRISRKGTVLFFSLVRKERGVPQRFANLWTPGSDSNLRSIHGFR